MSRALARPGKKNTREDGILARDVALSSVGDCGVRTGSSTGWTREHCSVTASNHVGDGKQTISHALQLWVCRISESP